MDLNSADREEVWLLLADLFFLDTEHPDTAYQTAAATGSRAAAWSAGS